MLSARFCAFAYVIVRKCVIELVKFMIAFVCIKCALANKDVF